MKTTNKLLLTLLLLGTFTFFSCEEEAIEIDNPSGVSIEDPASDPEDDEEPSQPPTT